MELEATVEGTIKVPKEYVSSSHLKHYTYNKITYDGEEVVHNYYQTSEKYWLPRNIDKFKKLFPNISLKYNLIANESTSFSFNEGIALYDYQEPFVDSILDVFKDDINCLAQAKTRFGKSICATAIIQKLKQKTLILVDKTLLVNQFVSDIKTFTNADIAILDKDLNDSTITIATFQFLNKNPDILKQIKLRYGLVIVDELHVSAANTYKRIIQSFPSRYRLGLTATPSRSSDGLTTVLFDLFGEVKVVGHNPNDMTVKWYCHQAPLSYNSIPFNPSASYNKYFLQEDIVNDIVGLVSKYSNRTIMLATPSQKVQNYYADLFETLGYTTCVFNSESKNKKAQDENIQKVKDGEIQLFTGLNVMLKGVSIPRLSLVINMMALSSKENVDQLVGRLKTKFDNKPEPLFINYVPKWGTYKSNKVIDILEELDNVEHILQ